MVTDRRQERVELVNHLIAGRKASELPLIHQVKEKIQKEVPSVNLSFVAATS